MSFSSFIKNGVSFNSNLLRSQYDPDQFQEVAPSFSYKGECVVTQSMGNKTVYRMDNAIEITTFSEELQRINENCWRVLQNKCLTVGSVSLLLGICSGTAAALEAASVAPLIALAVLCSGVAIFVFYRAHEAFTERKNWASKLPQYAEQRQACDPHREGFLFAKNHDLKGKIVTTAETQSLWFEAWKKLTEKRTSTSLTSEETKAKFVDQFFHQNPIGKPEVHYAFDESNLQNPREPARLYQRSAINEVSGQFAIYQTQYREIKSSFKKLKDKVNANRHQLLAKNDAAKDAYTLPFRALHKSYMKQIDQKRRNIVDPIREQKDQAIQKIQDSYRHIADPVRLKEKEQAIQEIDRKFNLDPSVKSAEQEFQAQKSKYDLMLTLALSPINNYFQRVADEINQKSDEAIENLKRDEFSSLSRLISAVDLLISEFNRCDTSHDIPSLYPDISSLMEPSAFIVLPSAPPMDEMVDSADFASGGFTATEWRDFRTEAHSLLT